jgi:hypothetical protein
MPWRYPEDTPHVNQSNLSNVFSLLSSFNSSPLQSLILESWSLSPLLAHIAFLPLVDTHSRTLRRLSLLSGDNSVGGSVHFALLNFCQERRVELEFRGRYSKGDRPLREKDEEKVEVILAFARAEASKLLESGDSSELERLLGSLIERRRAVWGEDTAMGT